MSRLYKKEYQLKIDLLEEIQLKNFLAWKNPYLRSYMNFNLNF